MAPSASRHSKPPGLPGPPPPPPPLNVLIVGAGIGGLSAATALRRAGHYVQLFEQSAFANEIGAAIHVGPNASRILRSFGYDEVRMRGTQCLSMTMFTPEGKVVHNISNEHVPKVYGSPWYLAHRVDLHNELKHLALDDDGEGKPAKLHLSAKVVSVDSEAGKLTLASGEEFHGDLIIGADGIHSILRDHVLGHPSSPPPTGQAAYRFIIPVSTLPADDPELSLFIPDTEKPGMLFAVGPTKRLVIYPCRDATMLNVVAIHPDRNNSCEGWNTNSASSVEDLSNEYSEFGGCFHALFKLATDVRLWQLRERGAIETWIKGRVGLLGDACHPMLPHQGQGGGQAIEDGAALGVIFKGVGSNEVPLRLKYYEYARKQRAETIQSFSRAFMAWGGREVPGGLDPRTVRSFTFRHDVQKYAEQALGAVWFEKIVGGTFEADG